MAACMSKKVWEGGQYRCALGDPHFGDHGTMVGAPGTAVYQKLSWPNENDTRPGCCSACNGTGIDIASPETNGRCWDCYGTGHAHKPEKDC